MALFFYKTTLGLLKTGRNLFLVRHLATPVVGGIPLGSPCPPEPEYDPCKEKSIKGLVLGVYNKPEDVYYRGKFTPAAEKYNRLVCGRLRSLLEIAPIPELGEVRLYYDIDTTFAAVALVGLGRQCLGYDVFEQIDEGKEAIRIAAAKACQALQGLKLSKLYIESFGHAESAAEGAALGVWLYQEKRKRENQIVIPQLELHDDCDWTGWQIGLQKAAAQNLARQLMDTPANLMTPTSFAQNAVEILCKAGINVEVKVKAWCEAQKMGAFLAVGQGSCEPPIFMEISYYGASKDERPVVLVGKGITYNSGGLNIKPPEEQKFMRGDMGGAANIVAATRAVAGLQLPINIRGLIPLCEHMLGCSALRSGDILKAANGKCIGVDSTNNAGKLTLADALVYAQNFWPRFIVSIGSGPKDFGFAMGSSATAVFTSSEALWEYMLAASMHTGDRVWRFPLWKYYEHAITTYSDADVRCPGKPRRGKGCKSAAFLNQFVPCGDWLHMDIVGVNWANGKVFPYLQEGMSGRPCRTLVEFLSQLVCHRE